MWVKGRWIKEERTVSCAYCSAAIITSHSRKRFCSETCRSNYNGKEYHKRHAGTRDYYLKRLCAKAIRSNLSHTQLEEIFQSQLGLCALSGVPMTWHMDGGKVGTNISIDRIIPAGEYVVENIRLVCSTVNMMRSNMTDDELRFWCSAINTK